MYLAGLNVEPPKSVATPPAQSQVSEAERTWPWIKDTTSHAVLENFIKQFGDTPYGPTARARLEELKRQQVVVAAPQLARVSVAPIIGAPDAIAKQIQLEFTSAVEKQRVSVTSGKDEGVDYILRGYIVAAKDKAATKVSYIWDITDPTGKRVNRITGEEVVSANAGKDPWGALTPQVAQSIAGKAASSFVAWLPSVGAQPAAAAPPAEPAVAIIPTPSRCDGVETQVGNERRCLKPGDSFKDCGECPEMVVIPAGEFLMGSPDNEFGRDSDEGPLHRVTFSRQFAAGKFAVTFADWDACIAKGGCNAYRSSDKDWGRGNRPVINVNWEDAKAYVNWLSKATARSYRLLSETEREYVTRAGTTTPFWWGSSMASEANHAGAVPYPPGSSNSQARLQPAQQTLPVDSFKANPWGLYQVHGNVSEWVEDCWNNSYRGAPSDGSPWISGDCSRRVLRGGGVV